MRTMDIFRDSVTRFEMLNSLRICIPEEMTWSLNSGSVFCPGTASQQKRSPEAP
mgnify:CR=1 FL=1